jgi:hypothetical protein
LTKALVAKRQSMTKPTLLLAVTLFCLTSNGQQADTLVLFYKPGKFNLAQSDQKKLDSFMLQKWDKITITGHTDDTEDEDFNLELSKKRAEPVYAYCLAKDKQGSVSYGYFGEAIPVADNDLDNSRALNRRTEIVGYRYPRRAVATVTSNPMTPVTNTLDNGLIVTYRRGTIPDYLAASFDAGLANNFQLVTNTIEMRQNNLYNNTTRGEILSSVMIVCGSQVNPCKLDSPILMKVPIPDDVVCPIEKVKFFNATLEQGKYIWQEQSKSLYPEVINGKKYIRIWLNDLCTCFNFDFNVDPDCFETDTTQMLIVNADIKNLTAELKGLNSVYLPKKASDSTYEVLFLKNKLNDAAITFGLYKGKRRIRGFSNQQLSAFPYDPVAKRYVFSTASVKIYFPKLEVLSVVLRVNKDTYRVVPDKDEYSFLYLNREAENITVDFAVAGPRGKAIIYKNQPIESLPYNEARGGWVIDKSFIKYLQRMSTFNKSITQHFP